MRARAPKFEHVFKGRAPSSAVSPTADWAEARTPDATTRLAMTVSEVKVVDHYGSSHGHLLIVTIGGRHEARAMLGKVMSMRDSESRP
jgi:hypothetical protein